MFKQFVEGILEDYKNQLSSYGTTPTEKWRTNTIINGNNAVLVILERNIYSEKAYHVICMVESPNGGGVAWVQLPHPCGNCLSGE